MKTILKILSFVSGALATICLGAFYYFIHTGDPARALLAFAFALVCALLVALFNPRGFLRRRLRL
jgi:uncharacterized membrane protein